MTGHKLPTWVKELLGAIAPFGLIVGITLGGCGALVFVFWPPQFLKAHRWITGGVATAILLTSGYATVALLRLAGIDRLQPLVQEGIEERATAAIRRRLKKAMKRQERKYANAARKRLRRDVVNLSRELAESLEGEIRSVEELLEGKGVQVRRE